MVSESTLAVAAMSPPSHPPRVTILYKQHSLLDEQVLRVLETGLTARGFPVFVDHFRHSGFQWAREVERQIREADFLVPLLSPDSMQSDLVRFEIETAHDIAQQCGHPIPVPIRLKYKGPLPEALEPEVCESADCILWEGPQDDQRLIIELIQMLERRPSPQTHRHIRINKPTPLVPSMMADAAHDLAHPRTQGLPLETVGGAVPMHSNFYVLREADVQFYSALAREDSTILLHGPRQVGKTSMLARGLQFKREQGVQVALTDFQKFNVASFANLDTFFMSLAESLADQLDLPVWPSDVWDERYGAALNFERYLRREVLPPQKTPLVWGLDEVDRLFVAAYGKEVFASLRHWHNQRELHRRGVWAKLTVAMAYATEARLFISTLSRTPFGAGTQIELQDFSKEQVADLNRRHGRPLKNKGELGRFFHLVSGHPYLVRRGLQEMTSNQMAIDEFESQADGEEGFFGEHLQRMLILLARDSDLTEVVRTVLRGSPCPTEESFCRLRSAGLLAGSSPRKARMRCRLYFTYLSRNLL